MNALAPGSLLGQVAPANTTAVALVTATLRTEITRVIICNVTAGAVTFRLFHDQQGATYAVSNALYYDVSIPGNTTLNLDAEMHSGITLAATDTLGCRTGTGAALTFSAYGVVQAVR